MIPIFRIATFVSAGSLAAMGATLQVSAVNKLQVPRGNETLEIKADALKPLGAKSLQEIHVTDAKGAEVLCQAVDSEPDELRTPDLLIFQSDFASGETKTFKLSVGPKQVYKLEQYKAFGRFVRERFDDFAWENDRIAHRTYGHALESWKGEPLTSSTIDIWSKRTPKMVINNWYLEDDYHVDHGEGADFYSAGKSRGCGGSGVWAQDSLWTSNNFVSSNVLANGPIRVLFELEYAPFNVAGQLVSEKKRVSLDAGSQFDRFESTYNAVNNGAVPVAGLKIIQGEQVASDAAQGWLATWQKMEKNAGMQGLAVISTGFDKTSEGELDHLVQLKPEKSNTVVYWAGFAWDKAGKFTDAAKWTASVQAKAAELKSPIETTITAGQ